MSTLLKQFGINLNDFNHNQRPFISIIVRLQETGTYNSTGIYLYLKI